MSGVLSTPLCTGVSDVIPGVSAGLLGLSLRLSAQQEGGLDQLRLVPTHTDLLSFQLYINKQKHLCGNK